MAEKKPKHKIVKRFKIFSDMSSNVIEQKLDEWAAKHEVVSVNVNVSNLDQKGMMLCERLDPHSDIAWLFVATVCYKFDETEKQVNDAMTQWVVEKIKERFGDVDKHPPFFMNPETGLQRTKKELISDYVEKLRTTPEYLNAKKNYELFYSEEREN